MAGSGMALSFNERMPRGTTRYYPHTTLYGGLTLNLVCHRPVRGEKLLLITNRTGPQASACTLWPALGYRDDLCVFEIERI